MSKHEVKLDDWLADRTNIVVGTTRTGCRVSTEELRDNILVYIQDKIDRNDEAWKALAEAESMWKAATAEDSSVEATEQTILAWIVEQQKAQAGRTYDAAQRALSIAEEYKVDLTKLKFTTHGIPLTPVDQAWCINWSGTGDWIQRMSKSGRDVQENTDV